jgi:anaerobic magnesium-protoporphyrin IX monomethyl ester cyclase
MKTKLLHITPISKGRKKRILLINSKRKQVLFTPPHNGLAILAAIIKEKGHEVKIVDYSFSFKNKDKDISFFVNDFKPDVIGISIYTPNALEAGNIISRLNEIDSKIPIMVGGPHATLYTDVLEKNKKIDYIFRGEAELTILNVIEKAKKEKKPVVINSEFLVDLDALPFPDYKSFYDWESMTHYSIMTSRGCPFQCCFCASAGLAYRRWRPRDPEKCIQELEKAQKEISPNLKFVVFDDNPITDKERFKKFLRMYSERIKSELTVVNVRADGIDDEFLELLKKCKVDFISIGVEHAHPEVFKWINKGETLEQIEKAAKLIKKHKINLGLSFVIGTPYDNLERTKESIKFCRKVKADDYSINLITPYRYTAARKWFEENNAKLYDEVGHLSQPINQVRCLPSLVETPDFTRKEREKAYYMFLMGVADQTFRLSRLPQILPIIREYDLYGDFFSWIPRAILLELKLARKFIRRGVLTYRTSGFLYLIKRYVAYRNQTRIK